MAARRTQRQAIVGAESPDERVAAVMAVHGRTLLRVAHHWSICHDDALDAYQRALEIFLRRAETVDRATEAAWLKVVVKHEALAIRRTRQESVGSDDVDLDTRAAADQRSVEEQIAGGERISRSAEALRALKPDEARALMLKAEGLSYQEIGKRCGWTYTKVNRAITEGRRRFLRAYAAIESGGECDRFAPLLAALAAGTATSAQVLEIRPHLRHCMACRATVRELHISILRRAELWLPLGWLPARDPHPPGLAEQLLRDGGELVSPPTPSWLARLGGWVHRANPTDVATGVHLASGGGGGGRIGAIAAILGFCASSLGAATVCVISGVVPNPLVASERVEPATPRAKAAARLERPPAVVAESIRASETAAPTSTPRPRGSSDPSQRRTPRAHREPPASPVAESATAEFTFEQAGTATQADPAPPPATGGSEFTP